MSEPLWFAGGLTLGLMVGVTVGWLLNRRRDAEFTAPSVISATCTSDGQLHVEGSAGSAPSGMNLVGLYSYVFETEPTTLTTTPPSGALFHTAFPFDRPFTTSGVDDWVVVWAVYCATSNMLQFSCSGGGSGSNPGPPGPFTPESAAHLEIVPKALRLSSGGTAPGTGKGPAADLARSLANGGAVVLSHVPEESSPSGPFWRARGQAVEWSLRLAAWRDGAFGAVLMAVCRAEGKEARFTWVASRWRSNADTHFQAEPALDGVPELVVSPA
jgi:hypothetical protein